MSHVPSFKAKGCEQDATVSKYQTKSLMMPNGTALSFDVRLLQLLVLVSVQNSMHSLKHIFRLGPRWPKTVATTLANIRAAHRFYSDQYEVLKSY